MFVWVFGSSIVVLIVMKVLPLLFLPVFGLAFSPSRGLPFSRVPTRGASRLHAIDPSAMTSALADLHHFGSHVLQNANVDAIAHGGSHASGHFGSQASMIIADAQAATADVVEAGKEKSDWWANFINLFKQALLFVHDDLVDPQLQKLGITETWGYSIAAFTFLVRSTLVPLSVQQTKSSEYMKALKPYQQEIKEKFKDNKDMQNKAIGKLFEDANQNPLAGKGGRHAARTHTRAREIGECVCVCVCGVYVCLFDFYRR